MSGGDDQCVKLWKLESRTAEASCVQTVQDHTAPINCIATLKTGQTADGQSSTVFATGAADATIKVWAFDGNEIKVLQTIKTSPKYFPLAVALSPLGDDGNTYILASAGTRHTIQIYVGAFVNSTTDFSLQATLSGHEGWLRSLDFTAETPNAASSDLLLASASQDKYIRLWRIHQGAELPVQAATASDPTVGAYLPGRSPSNKAHRFKSSQKDFSITFESLLFNHDDWIYSAKWHGTPQGTLQLLSTSADNSLAIWEPDQDSGIWVTSARLGEISREKGATTATGSIGGFWTGLWSPAGTSILTLGRTGSWRRWGWDTTTATWAQDVSVSGHVRPVTGIAWARSGSHILSTSADQTTRLHAPWQTRKEGAAAGGGGGSSTWHEMARPQIHGYDLNCIDVLDDTRFVSGADEKLLRVFAQPRAVARMLHTVAGIGEEGGEIGSDMPDAANMPVLGLSNKATVDDDGDDASAVDGPAAAAAAVPGAAAGTNSNPETDRDAAIDPATIARRSALEIDHPPFEESLSRHTLWPEIEKLYGHGYELSCLAASHDGKLIASACKASSLNHAVIRIFETERWTELRPPLAVHTLTTTRLRFSGDDRYLLSVGRDRQWAVFEKREVEKEGEMGYALLQAEPKGHTRMILDGSWAPVVEGQPRIFATAGRDKSVKIWAVKEEGKFGLAASVPDDQPVTSIDFLPRRESEGKLVLASGNEAGKIRIHALKVDGSEVSVVSTYTMQPE